MRACLLGHIVQSILGNNMFAFCFSPHFKYNDGKYKLTRYNCRVTIGINAELHFVITLVAQTVSTKKLLQVVYGVIFVRGYALVYHITPMPTHFIWI